MHENAREIKLINTVLIYRHKLLPYSETFIKEQAKALKSWDYLLLGDRYEQGIELCDVKTALLYKSKLSLRFLTDYFVNKINSNHVLSLKALKKLDVSVLHIHFGTDAVKFWPIAKQFNKPIVVTLHGYDITTDKAWWESGRRGKRRKDYPAKLLEMAAHPLVSFIAISEVIKQSAIAFGIPSEKIKVLYIGIDTNKFHPAGKPILQRKKRIVYVGRMVEVKGGSTLINAYSKLLKVVPDAELVMVGDGVLLESYRTQASLLKLPVEFAGIKTSAEVKALLDTARVFCLPSVTTENGNAEGMGVVILEAQACGVPVVTSARGGAAEGIVHGETGFAFTEYDEDSLVKYLEQLLTDDALVLAMSQQGVKFMLEKFDISTCTEKLEDYYNQLVSSAAIP
jgi:glycosyltransferase involved in cell wall biosynthesis